MSTNSIDFPKIWSDLSILKESTVSPILTGILTLAVIFYGGFVSSSLGPDAYALLNSPFARIVFLAIVLGLRMYNPIASLGILVTSFVVLTLCYVFSWNSSEVKVHEKPDQPTQSDQEEMLKQLRMDLSSSRESSDMGEQNGNGNVANDHSTSSNQQTTPGKDTLASLLDTTINAATKLTNLLIPSQTTGPTEPKKDSSEMSGKGVGDQTNLEQRVEHPDSPYHPSYKQPYGVFSSSLKGVDVNLTKLNPPFTVKNLPLNYNNATHMQQVRLPTPHADTAPALYPVKLSKSTEHFANMLNPQIAGFASNEEEICPMVETCNMNGGKVQSSDKNFYARNYHLIGGDNDAVSQEMCQRRYAENETALNNIIQTNMGVLISSLIAELKYTLTEKEIRENLCDIIRTILKHRNTTLREFFNNQETYRSFVRLVLLVAEKVENSTSMSIIHDVFGDVLKQIRHIVAEKLDTNVARRIADISDIREKAKKVNLDQICNFPPETIGLNNGIQLYGGSDYPQGLSKSRDPSLPDEKNLHQVVTVRANQQFSGPQGMLSPNGYPGVKYGARW